MRLVTIALANVRRTRGIFGPVTRKGKEAIVLLQRIQADDFRDESDLAIAGLRPGVNAILLPDWQSAEELSQRIFNAFVGDKSNLSETVFFVSDEMGEAIMSDDEIAKLLSDFDVTLFESLYHDNVRAEEIGPLICDLDLAELFAMDESEPKPQSQDLGVREQIGFRNEVLQETLLNAKREFDGSRNSLRGSDHLQYANLINKRSALLSSVGKSKKEIAQLESRMAPLMLANDVAELWRRRDKLKRRSRDTRSLDSLIAKSKDIAELDSQIARLRKQIADVKRSRRKGSSSSIVSDQAGSTERSNALRRLISESERAETAEHECEHLRRAIRDAVASNEYVTSVASAGDTRPTRAFSLERSLRVLAPFAERVRLARHRLRLVENRRQLTNVPHDGVVTEAAAMESEAVDEIRDLSEQVEVLNQACEQIRSRQSLPTGAIGGILAMFLSGLALVGFGMMFQMAGNSWLAIGLGVLAMFSAGMLKISLERAPLVQLRFLRAEISGLLERIAMLQSEDDEKIMSSLDPSISMGVAQDQLDVALHNWREALVTQDLPESLSPNQLYQYLKSADPDHKAFLTLAEEFDHSCDDLFAPISSFELRADAEPNLTYTTLSPDPVSPQGLTSAESAHLDELRSSLESESAILNRWRHSAAVELRTTEDALRDYPVPSITDDLRQAFARFEEATERELGLAAETEDAEKDLQSQLKRLKRRRKESIAETGVESLVELKELIRTERKRSGHKAKVADLNSQIDEALAASRFGDDARGLLEAYDYEELATRTATVQSEKAAAEQVLLDNQRRLSQMSQQIDELTENRDLDSTRLESAVASAKIKKATQDLVSNLILQEVLEARVEPTPSPKLVANTLLTAASEYFQRTTPWTEAEIRFDEPSEQFYIERIGHFSEPLNEVDDDFALQATICLQLSLFEHFRTTGLTMPVLLNDQWTHPSRRFAEETVKLLGELGTLGHQFLAMTWNDPTADFFRKCGEPVLVVNREVEHFSREETIVG